MYRIVLVGAMLQGLSGLAGTFNCAGRLEHTNPKYGAYLGDHILLLEPGAFGKVPARAELWSSKLAVTTNNLYGRPAPDAKKASFSCSSGGRFPRTLYECHNEVLTVEAYSDSRFLPGQKAYSLVVYGGNHSALGELFCTER